MSLLEHYVVSREQQLLTLQKSSMTSSLGSSSNFTSQHCIIIPEDFNIHHHYYHYKDLKCHTVMTLFENLAWHVLHHSLETKVCSVPH